MDSSTLRKGSHIDSSRRAVPHVLWDVGDTKVFVVIAVRNYGESLQISNHQKSNSKANLGSSFGGSSRGSQVSLNDPSNQIFAVVYSYVPSSVSGSQVRMLGAHPMRSLPGTPLVFSRGFLVFQTRTGSLERVLLDTHR